MTGNAIKNACEMLVNAMKKTQWWIPDVSGNDGRNIPVKYSGKWTASMCAPCDENGQGSPFRCTCTACSWLK